MKRTQQLASEMLELPIFERATLMPLASIEHIILKPENLALAYYAVHIPDEEILQYIQCAQVAAVSGWLTTNRAESFGERDDFVRDKQLLALNCTLFGYKVRDTAKRYIGTIQDYSFSDPDLITTRLYVRRPFWQRLRGEQLIISRTQVVEVLPEKRLVIINHLDKKVRQTAAKAIPA